MYRGFIKNRDADKKESNKAFVEAKDEKCKKANGKTAIKAVMNLQNKFCNNRFEKKPQNLLFRFKTLKMTMVFFFSVLIIAAVFIFLLVSIRYTEDRILKNSKTYTLQMVEQVNTDIDSYFSYMENISSMMVQNADVSRYLFSENSSAAVREETREKVASQFKTIMETRPDITNIAILADNGRYVIDAGDKIKNTYADLNNTDWYIKAKQANGSTVLSTSHVQNIVQDDYPWVVTLSRALYNPTTGKIEGVFFVDLNYSSISNLCKSLHLGTKGYVFVIDENGGIVYHPRQTLIYSGLAKENITAIQASKTGNFVTHEGKNSKLYTIYTSQKTGWSVIGVAYVNELLQGREETQAAYIVIACVLLLIAVAIASILAAEITKPIKILTRTMREVEMGDFDQEVPVDPVPNEIGVLGKAFNTMTKRIKELMEQIILEQKQKRKSELIALQSQINPHFLYNTLDSIIWMAEGGKNKEVILMTSYLAKLLRQSISNDDEIVTIEQELSYTRSYLAIQKMRYQDKLEYEIDVDEASGQALIVKLVLQPLVENAIYHGIKYREHGGMIRVYTRMEETRICLFVEDNGQGMDEDQVQELLSERKKVNPNEDSVKNKQVDRHGLGIANVNNRLKLFYGTAYGLQISSQKGLGTTVCVTIPYEKGGV